MSSWILQHFLNPAYFWPGLALVSLPIIIHLINRLRYKRVRFAAMEFLLASQKRNRRRLLIEQLLLLLLRVAMVLLLVALIGRLILDPDQLSLFQGARSHHVVILDDSASMQDRSSEGELFDSAKDVIRKMIAEGARRPGSQQLTLIRMSKPDETVSGLSERVVDDELLTELNERLEVMECTSQAADPAEALETALQRLADDRASVRHVHVLSDFRGSDWIDNKGAVTALQSLSSQEVSLNLVRCVENSHENLGIVALDGAVEVAAAGVPVTMQATIENFGAREVENVRAEVFVDGEKLPRTIDFQTIGAGKRIEKSFDVVFETAEPHEVRMAIGEDSLSVDNERFMAVDVPDDNPVLLVDGSPSTEQALYVADALAADRSVTGFAPSIRTPEDLRKIPLDGYHLIYLINVGELAPDAISAVEKYVANGGGLIWYMGDAVRPAFYNEKLFTASNALFPVRLGLAPEELKRLPTGSGTSPDIQLENEPMFQLFNDAEVPILDLVFVNLFYPVDDRPKADPAVMSDAKQLGELRNGAPLMFQHQYGKGQVFTCLTSAGPLMDPAGVVWTNWANGPASFSFAVFQLELAKQFVRKDRALPQLLTGTPLELSLNQAFYQSELEVVTPDNQASRLQANREEPEDDENTTSNDLNAIYRETDTPGVYKVTLNTQEQSQEVRLFAMNLAEREGAMLLAEDQELRRELGDDVEVQIQQAGSFEWIRSESPGSEIRWLLLILLALFCIAEQVLASRLSYQPE